MNLFLFLFLHPPQILTRGETHSHLVTLYLECITLPSTWTTRWSGMSLWDLCIWRASTRSRRATGRFRTTDTLVNMPQMLSPTSSLHIRVGDHMFSPRRLQSCCMLAVACRWAAEVFQMCTTPSSCTSTGEARPPTAPSTRWTGADTRWRYSTVSRPRRSVTGQLSQQTGDSVP